MSDVSTMGQAIDALPSKHDREFVARALDFAAKTVHDKDGADWLQFYQETSVGYYGEGAAKTPAEARDIWRIGVAVRKLMLKGAV